MKSLITVEELSAMFSLQEVLNIKYSGEDWYENISSGKIEDAIYAEYGEFLEEIRDDWCWYKSNPPVDSNKALFELIDVAHFAMMFVLHGWSVERVQQTLLQQGFNPEPYQLDMCYDSRGVMNRHLNRFLISCHSLAIEPQLQNMLNLFQIFAEYCGLKEGEFFKAYQMKNARNHERVDGGILTGSYNKANEMQLEIIGPSEE